MYKPIHPEFYTNAICAFTGALTTVHTGITPGIPGALPLAEKLAAGMDDPSRLIANLDSRIAISEAGAVSAAKVQNAIAANVRRAQDAVVTLRTTRSKIEAIVKSGSYPEIRDAAYAFIVPRLSASFITGAKGTEEVAFDVVETGLIFASEQIAALKTASTGTAAVVASA